MGLFDKFKEKNKMKVLTSNFKLLNGYNAVFTTFSEGIYEMELIRSAIESIVINCSKLNPIIVTGKESKDNKYKKLNTILQNKPNYLMTTQQFMQKLITILMCENNAYIIPVYENIFAEKIVGFYPVRSTESKIVNLDGINYLKYKINGEYKSIEYERVGHLRKHYYTKDFFGESNNALFTTIELLNTQNQGILQGIKQSASIRFLARLANVLMPKDLKAERERLVKENLGSDNNGGIMMFDNKYADIKPIDSKPFIIDDKQAELIKNNVMDYFHVSEGIIQNKASEDEWNSFYEGCIEPIAIQLSEVLTNMIFTAEELEKGYKIFFETSRMQFASNTTKLNVSTQLFDRGVLTTNQVMDIWNLPHVKDGDKRYIRKEYTEVMNLDKDVNNDGK